MSRSNYSEDLDNWALIKWRGAVASAIRGKRGQQLLLELAEAMDAMQVKELIANALELNGSYCALGVVGAKRGVDMRDLDPDDYKTVSQRFNVAQALACEIAYINDEDGQYFHTETPADRWKRVRAWVAKQVILEAKTFD